MLMSSVAVSKIQLLRWSGRCEGRPRGVKVVEEVEKRSFGGDLMVPRRLTVVNYRFRLWWWCHEVSDLVSLGGATSFFSENF